MAARLFRAPLKFPSILGNTSSLCIFHRYVSLLQCKRCQKKDPTLISNSGWNEELTSINKYNLKEQHFRRQNFSKDGFVPLGPNFKLQQISMVTITPSPILKCSLHETSRASCQSWWTRQISTWAKYSCSKWPRSAGSWSEMIELRNLPLTRRSKCKFETKFCDVNLQSFWFIYTNNFCIYCVWYSFLFLFIMDI